MLREGDFLRCMSLYREMYGQAKMTNDMMGLWWKRLKDLPNEEFCIVFGDVLGGEKWPFGWKKVWEEWARRYPPKPDMNDDQNYKLDKHTNDEEEKVPIRAMQKIIGSIKQGADNDEWQNRLFVEIAKGLPKEKMWKLANDIHEDYPEMKKWFLEKGEGIYLEQSRERDKQEYNRLSEAQEVGSVETE